MKFKRNKVATAVACVIGASAAVTLSNAFAQAVSPDVPSSTRPPADIRVDVTGSNIKRVEGEGSLPVQVITRSEIDKSGATTSMELLQLISANTSSGSVTLASSVGATTLSAQTASLRGLDGGHTLVLINGHRLQGFSGEIQGVRGVDLSAIPFSAIERVEVLKDGASAVYGSDAVAGVINFITRSDYTGAEVTGYYGSPTRGGGGEQWQGSGSFGFGDLTKDRYNVFFSAQYTEQKSLDQKDRTFSKTSYRPDLGLIAISSNTNPGLVTTGGIGVVNNSSGTPVLAANPANPQCGHNTFFNDDILGTGCYFDPSGYPGINMIPNNKLTNAFASGQFKINSDWTAYAQALYARQETHLVIQPGPISSVPALNYGPSNSLSAAILLPPTSPFYPHQLAADAGVDGEPLDVRYRTFDNGFRDTTDTNETFNITGGVKGAWKNWDWDMWGFYAEGKTAQRINGGFQDFRCILPLLNTGTVNLFGPNTPDIVAAENACNVHGDVINGKSKIYGGQAKTTGEIYKLPAGPLSLAFGIEGRKETLDQDMADVLAGGFITGFGGEIKDVSGERTQYATFAEVNIPIVKTLEANAAFRYDHYSDFGSTTNPKVSLRWQPARTMLVRASWGTGFLAPSLYQLNTPNIAGVSATGLNDPLRCPVTNNQTSDCNAQFGVLFGGNPNLKPEESEQATLGVVFEPVPNLTFSIDYFKINLTNLVVNGISPATILGNQAQYGSLITRGPVEPQFPGLPGPVLQIDQKYVNLGSVRQQGIDFEAHYRAPAQDWGRLSFDMNGTYYLRYDVQNTDGSYTGQVGTVYGAVVNGIIPRWKHYVALTWDLGPWSSTLAQTYQNGYTDAGTDIDGNLRKVGTLSLWDLQASYTGLKNWKFTLGVKNLWDTDPPASNITGSFVVGFDNSYYDPRSRFIYTQVTYAFK